MVAEKIGLTSKKFFLNQYVGQVRLLDHTDSKSICIACIREFDIGRLNLLVPVRQLRLGRRRCGSFNLRNCGPCMLMCCQFFTNLTKSKFVTAQC